MYEHQHDRSQEWSPLLLSQNSTSTETSSVGHDETNTPYPPSSTKRLPQNTTTTTFLDISNMASQYGTATSQNVGINLAKTAAGTGILALPFACQQGGILLFVVGTILIACWNVFGVKRLCDCLDLLVVLSFQQQSTQISSQTTTLADVDNSHASIQQPWKLPSPPPAGTATLGKIAYYALGDVGLVILDIMLLFLLSGIVIAYEVAILAFAKGTFLTSGKNYIDAVILAIVLVPLCMVDDMSNLSKLSHLGLIILTFAMLVIAGYGIIGFDDDKEDNNTDENGTEFVESTIADDVVDEIENDDKYNPFHFFPPYGLDGISHWFGCVVFGFGIVPLTFNFRESMAEPEKLPYTALISMLLVAMAYIVTGIGLLYLYPNIQNDVLSEIPEGGLATVTRLAMIVVVLATAPLLIVPCAEIIEGKIHHSDGLVHPKARLWARTCLSLFTVGISVMLPGFVSVLAFVGCFSVALVSFCVPPFLHWILLRQQEQQEQILHDHGPAIPSASVASVKKKRRSSLLLPHPRTSSAIDIILLICGLATTVVTTWYTFRKLVEKGSID